MFRVPTVAKNALPVFLQRVYLYEVSQVCYRSTEQACTLLEILKDGTLILANRNAWKRESNKN